MYRINTVGSNDADVEGREYWNMAEFVDPAKLCCHNRTILRRLIRSCHCLGVLKLRRQESMFDLASKHLAKELDLIEFIKARRFLKQAIKKLLSKKDRLDIKQRTRYYVIRNSELPSTAESTHKKLLQV